MTHLPDAMQSWKPPLRRDIATHTYKNATVFNVHAPQMRNAGWHILGHTVRGNEATVTWFRDVPISLPLNALHPALPSRGLHPLTIISLIIGLLVIVVAISAASNGGKTQSATATENNGATSRTLSSGTVASTSTASVNTPVSSATAMPTAAPTATIAPTMVPQVVVVKDNPVQVREAARADAAAIATLAVGTELSVLALDVTGSDGATRWVPVAANGRNGFVRSDLVTERQVYVPATATPVLRPTATNAIRPTATVDSSVIAVGLWYDRYGSILSALANDMNAASVASGNYDIAGVTRACRRLATDVQTAMSYPAIPEPEVAQHYKKALQYLSAAAQDCIVGAQTLDETRLRKTATEFDLATNELSLATTALRRLLRS